MKTRRRNSLHLRGFDYSQAGEYFVTICTTERRCVLGEVVKEKIRLSEIGKVVDECWREIPEHFGGTKVIAFQIMPNHVHGIITLKQDPVGDEYIHPLQRNVVNPARVEYIQPLRNNVKRQSQYQHVTPNSLESIIRSFKAAVTRDVHKRNLTQHSIWQRSFYDHIIRDDIDHFLVEQYIELNPLMWELDRDNPEMHEMSIEALRKFIKEENGLDGVALERIIEYESGYGNRV